MLSKMEHCKAMLHSSRLTGIERDCTKDLWEKLLSEKMEERPQEMNGLSIHYLNFAYS